jgi:hypothetical protein
MLGVTLIIRPMKRNFTRLYETANIVNMTICVFIPIEALFKPDNLRKVA